MKKKDKDLHTVTQTTKKYNDYSVKLRLASQYLVTSLDARSDFKCYTVET